MLVPRAILAWFRARPMVEMRAKTKPDAWVYELRITLQEILPPIWRLIQVPSTLRLCCLHDALQAAIGWTNSHLHRFEKDGKQWGAPEHFEDDDIDILDESRTRISDILTTPGDSVLYVYDFGDDWRHSVMLEKLLPVSGTTGRPVCVAGGRHCPPEDVGGVPGYQEFLEVVFNPSHEEFDHYVGWAEGPSPVNQSVGRFQPEEFDVRAVNDTLAHMRWPARHRR
jgi:pRiA4b ORF-3-like protein